MKDLVSVIIPVYNAEKTIRQYLTTVMNQTYYDIKHASSVMGQLNQENLSKYKRRQIIDTCNNL